VHGTGTVRVSRFRESIRYIDSIRYLDWLKYILHSESYFFPNAMNANILGFRFATESEIPYTVLK
jgi:hypothetical protein